MNILAIFSRNSASELPLPTELHTNPLACSQFSYLPFHIPAPAALGEEMSLWSALGSALPSLRERGPVT